MRTGKEESGDGREEVFASARIRTKSTPLHDLQPVVKEKNTPGFEKERRQELQGLISNGPYLPTKIHKVEEGTRIFGSRLIEDLKRAEAGLRGKRRFNRTKLVAKKYSGEVAAETVTKAPTIKRFSQRILLSHTESLPGMIAFTLDVTQPFEKSYSALERRVYLRPLIEMNLPDDDEFRVARPLYVIPESGHHWYLTILRHHQERLGMKRERIYP